VYVHRGCMKVYVTVCVTMSMIVFLILCAYVCVSPVTVGVRVVIIYLA